MHRGDAGLEKVIVVGNGCEVLQLDIPIKFVVLKKLRGCKRTLDRDRRRQIFRFRSNQKVDHYPQACVSEYREREKESRY